VIVHRGTFIASCKEIIWLATYQEYLYLHFIREGNSSAEQ